MIKKVYLVDYIGIHSGMHYYNSSFKFCLGKIDGLQIKILSNYNENGNSFFNNFFEVNRFLGLFQIVIGYFRLLYKLVTSSKDSLFILLTYGSIIDVIFLTITFFSKKVIIDVHEVYTIQLSGRFVKSMLSILYRRHVKTLIYHSKRSEELLNEIGYENKRIYVPHFKYRIKKEYKPEKIGSDIIKNIDNSRINILFFGYTCYAKGIDILLRAVNLLPDNTSKRINIIIAGKDMDGAINTVDIKQDLIVKRTLRYINDDELVFLFSNVEYVILPYRETSQSGVLEMAFYFNKPIIVTSLEYFKRLLSQFPSFGILMLGNDQSVANALINIVNFHDEKYCDYFTNTDLSKFNENNGIDAFLLSMRNIINDDFKS